jgi:hypothetical protein
MKKILLVLALTLTGFLSQAQVTVSSGAHPNWNLDTAYATGAASQTGSWFGKTISVPTNFILNIDVKIVTDSTCVASGGLTTGTKVMIYGSMDNVYWTKVGSASNYNPPISWSVSPLTSFDVATYPNNTYTAYGSSTSFDIAALTADAAALPTAVPLIAGVHSGYFIHATIKQPEFSYYKVVVLFATNTTTGTHRAKAAARYYLRKPY